MYTQFRMMIIGCLIISNGFAQEARLKELIADADVGGLQLVYTKGTQSKAYYIGLTGKGSTHKINAQSIFQAASLSKTVFAYAVLRWYDRGLIDLDKPLLDYYQGRYNRFDPKDPNYAKITARMVLRHTTGLPNWGNDSLAVLLFKPDSCFSYSGEGYQFLQKVMEQKFGKPLNQLMQEEVFIPLGMKLSGYAWKPEFDSIATMAHQTKDEINRYSTANANAAYSLLTNANDFTIFLKALIEGRGLKPQTRQMMFDQASDANRYNRPIGPADPYIDWGLGVGLQKNEKGRAIWHWGDNGDYKCFYMAFPATHETLIYFTHSQNGLDMAGDILPLFFGPGQYWVTKWLSYGYESPVAIKAFRAGLDKTGYDHAGEMMKEMEKKDSSFKLSENDLNKFGYYLLRKERKQEAVRIFQLNADLHPTSGNVFDSLAEGYDSLGNTTLALENYKRSLTLDPNNDNAAENIKRLEKK